MRAGFEFFAAPAGVGVVGRGPTLPETFAQAALAAFSLIVSPGEVEEHEVREVRAHGESLEALLVSWLDECLYLHDVEGFVACRIAVDAFQAASGSGGEPMRLHGVLHGEEVDAGRHRPGTVVRAAGRRGLSIGPAGGGFEARLVLET